MNFEYLETIRRDASIEIDVPGQTNLQAFTDDGRMFVLSIKTKMGFTTVKQFGPYNEEGKQEETFNYSRYQLEYKDQKIHQIIKDFLNGRIPKTQVFEIEDDMVNNLLEDTRL